MSRRNYRVYEDIGNTQQEIFRKFAVLDTGEVSNFVKAKKLPKKGVYTMIGGNQNHSDENGHPLKILGTVRLFLILVSYVVKYELFVCENLDTSYVLGRDFSNIFVEDIKPRNRVVELDDREQI